jgi:hypothetical protein
MTVLLCDGAGFGYLAITALCLYGGSLFTWGLFVARKQGWHVSLFYIYTLSWFFSLGYASLLAAMSRLFTLVDPSASHAFRMSLLWQTRTVPLICVLIGIVSHMTYRAFWLNFENKEE